LPVALVEAMAAGKPVVATAVSGTPEVVTDGETGFLVEPKNADQLAERITRLIEDPSLRDRMGRAARIRVKEKFSAATMIRATEQLYQELLESQ
jgi:glycosyltransferase involved in cell wall biosynthesis